MSLKLLVPFCAMHMGSYRGVLYLRQGKGWGTQFVCGYEDTFKKFHATIKYFWVNDGFTITCLKYAIFLTFLTDLL